VKTLRNGLLALFGGRGNGANQFGCRNPSMRRFSELSEKGRRSQRAHPGERDRSRGLVAARIVNQCLAKLFGTGLPGPTHSSSRRTPINGPVQAPIKNQMISLRQTGTPEFVCTMTQFL
jgi:hypothetical protein